MQFVEIHSIDSDKDMIINTRYIAEIENRSDGGINIWLTTDAGTMRMIRTTMNRQTWIEILDVKLNDKSRIR